MRPYRHTAYALILIFLLVLGASDALGESNGPDTVGSVSSAVSGSAANSKSVSGSQAISKNTQTVTNVAKGGSAMAEGGSEIAGSRICH